MPVKKYSDYG